MLIMIIFILSALFLLVLLRKKEINKAVLFFAVVSPVVMQFAAAVFQKINSGWCRDSGMVFYTFVPLAAGLLAPAAGALPTWIREKRAADKHFDEMNKKEKMRRIEEGDNYPEGQYMMSIMNYEAPPSPALDMLEKPFIYAAAAGALLWLVLVRIAAVSCAGFSSADEYYYYPLMAVFLMSPLITKLYVPEIKKSFIVFGAGILSVYVVFMIILKMKNSKPEMHFDFNPGIYILFLILFIFIWCISLYAFNSDGFSSVLKTTTYRNTYRNGVLVNREYVGESIRSLGGFKLSPEYMSFFFWSGIWMAGDSLLRLIVSAVKIFFF